ncbi:MAG: Bax inhibitor-1/YccA family protein [Acutalibacteraceae bacterium]|nr:Bax inhibitor-1/YccA family protein [Acutalibacteraceae bacterium]HIR03029.1 Bax inhibitor-1/YccA family protein [Candidatus Scatovicinus merdipullorum]
MAKKRLATNPPISENEKNTNIFANPVIRKLNKVTERAAEGEGATYSGITIKTVFFLLVTIGGIALYYLLQAFYFSGLPQEQVISDDIAFSFSMVEILFVLAALVFTIAIPILTMFVHKGIPFTGSLYSVSQGFLLGWVIEKLLGGYEWIAWAALGITILLVAIMAVLYTARIIKVTKKFRTILTVLFVTMIFSSLACVVFYFIPATSSIVAAMLNNPVLSIIVAVIGIIIATLFLLVDFDTIEKTVTNCLPQKYEWVAAFGLAFTVIWIYLKVLDLLMSVNNK